MDQVIYYNVKGHRHRTHIGPNDERKILKMYKKSEFKMESTFKFVENGQNAPIITLQELIAKNGVSNPFREATPKMKLLLDERNTEYQKLEKILNMKGTIERRIDEIGERMVEIANEENTDLIREIQKEREEKMKDNKRIQKLLPNWLMEEKLPQCADCDEVFASAKQVLLHAINDGCRHEYTRFLFDQAYDWEDVDGDKRAMGNELFREINPSDWTKCRPRGEFIEKLDRELKKRMEIYTKKGLEKTRGYLGSDNAKWLCEEFIEHLKEEGKGVICVMCTVACKTIVHYILHLCTFDHRKKVIGTPFELISILIGYVYRACYLAEPDPSEYELDKQPDLSVTLEELRMRELPELRIGDGETKYTDSENETESESECGCEEEEEEEEEEVEEDEPVKECDERCRLSLAQEMQRLTIAQELQFKPLNSCEECDAMFTNFMQFLSHLESKWHNNKLAKAGKTNENEDWLRIFHHGLHEVGCMEADQWFSGMAVHLLFERMNREELRPTVKFMRELNEKLEEKLARREDGKHDFGVARKYFGSIEHKSLMDSFEKHLKEKKFYVCEPCVFATADDFVFYGHYISFCHVKKTHATMYELPTVLIGVNKKGYYEGQIPESDEDA